MTDEPQWTPWRITLWGEQSLDPRLAKMLRDDSVDGLKSLGVDMSAFEYDSAMAELGEARSAFQKEYARRNRLLVWQVVAVVAFAMVAVVAGVLAQ